VNILIVKLSAIGDVIHTLASLAALRELYPKAHITWVVEEAASGLVVGHPLLDEVIVLRRKSWIKLLKGGKVGKVLKEARLFTAQVRVRRYDLIIDFHGLFKSAAIVFLSRGKRKLGYDSWQELTRLFYNERIHEDMNKHAADRYLDFPRHLGASVSTAKFILPLTGETQKQALSLMAKYHLPDKRFIAINPIAYWETKLWNNEKFASLGDSVKNELKLDVVFTGSKKEDVQDIITHMKTGGINLAGQTTLPVLAEIYKRAACVITTDSGPMHLAAAVGTPVIALFGPTNPARTGPYGKGHTVITSNLPCSPCLLRKCPTGQCMKDIMPRQVLEATKAVMQRLPLQK